VFRVLRARVARARSVSRRRAVARNRSRMAAVQSRGGKSRWTAFDARYPCRGDRSRGMAGSALALRPRSTRGRSERRAARGVDCAPLVRAGVLLSDRRIARLARVPPRIDRQVAIDALTFDGERWPLLTLRAGKCSCGFAQSESLRVLAYIPG